MKQHITLICPRCGNSFILSDAIRELEQREIADIASKFGQSWRLIYEYTDCFRKSETGGMQRSKRVRLLKEVSRLFDTCEFKYEGKRYRTTWPEVIGAITQICNAEKFGLKNHNYLKVILLKTAKRVSAEGMTAAEEEEREKGRRGPGEKGRKGESEQFLGEAPPDVAERIGSILNKLGRTE